METRELANLVRPRVDELRWLGIPWRPAWGAARR